MTRWKIDKVEPGSETSEWIHFSLNQYRQRLKPYAVAMTGLMFLAMVAGGASQQNALPLTVVEIAALASDPFLNLQIAKFERR